MAFLFSASTPLLCSTSTTTRGAALFEHSISCHESIKFTLSSSVFYLGIAPLSQWSGLKHLGVSKFLNKERKRKCKSMAIHASLFGVGAPEALVIGVVALLVFGPKGLAEVARNLGKTLRAFQPTIRELQDVSREFKSTLEQEIGLDDIRSQTPSTYSRSNRANAASGPSSFASTENSTTKDADGAPSQPATFTSEEYPKILEEQLKPSVEQQQGETPPPGESQFKSPSQPQGPLQQKLENEEHDL